MARRHMPKRNRALYFVAFDFLVAFIAFTVAVKFIDVKPIGFNGTEIGFANFNGTIFERIGYNETFLKISEILGYVCFAPVLFFALLGLNQLVYRKSPKKVDLDLYALAAFYIVVLIVYFIFTKVSINYRPTELEFSYPSSHTLLAICVMGTALLQFKNRFKTWKGMVFVKGGCWALLILTILCRFVSGVHWFTDYVGSFLLSGCLIFFYLAFSSQTQYVANRRDRLKSLN